MGCTGNNPARTLLAASRHDLARTLLIVSLNNAEYNRTVCLIMEVVLAVVTLATAVKDIVELGQKIYESFAKVSRIIGLLSASSYCARGLQQRIGLEQSAKLSTRGKRYPGDDRKNQGFLRQS